MQQPDTKLKNPLYTDAMKASVAGRIRNTTLPANKALLPVFEAIMNSFQAIEERTNSVPEKRAPQKIEITLQRQGSLSDEGKPGIVECFIVKDTGIGFTDENYESFNTVDSTYKVSKGGKGLGRFLWLKAFNRVSIESHYKADLGDKLTKRSFDFVVADDEPTCKVEQSGQTAFETTVSLVGLKSPYRENCPRSSETIAEKIISHFLPFFIDPNGPQVFLIDDSKRINLRDVFKEHFKAFSSDHEFKAGSQKFKLSGFRITGSDILHNELLYGANFREVFGEKLGKYLPNLRGKLNDEERGNFTYIAFLQGDYLNQSVNSERTDFSIPREKPARSESEPNTDDLLADTLSLEEIRTAALDVVKTDLSDYLMTLNKTKEEKIAAYVEKEAPRYRILLKYQDEFLDQIPPDITPMELEMALHKQLYKKQVDLKGESAKILNELATVEDPAEYYRRFNDFILRFNELGKSDLADYVVHRKIILELLEKSLSQDADTGKYGLEKTVHSLVFPMRKTSEEVFIEQQNLWILDERLTYHSFLSSDKALNSLDAVESDSANRPDLLVYNNTLAFGDGNTPLTSVVIIEFKKPMRENYSEEDPLTQAFRMVRDIHAAKLQDKNGRPIRPASDKIPAYCHIICDITPALEIKLQDMGALRTPDNQGYYGFNPNLKAYYEVISYQKMLDDAKKRNRILFEKLNIVT